MNKPRILIVEDERVVAADIEGCLTGLGYEVVGSAATGAEALRLVGQTDPSLVLMDIKLKGALDGIDVAATIYQDLKIPVVYLTAHADREILERAKKTAPAGYVLKPFDERTLQAEIELAFDRHRRERELIEGGERLTSAMGSIDEAVIVIGADSRIAVMNRVAESLTGWKKEEAVGKNLGSVVTLLNAATGSLLALPTGRVFREGISVGFGEHTLLRGRQGGFTAIQGTAAPVREGENLGVCLLFRAMGQRAADEKWGSAGHSCVSRLEILGRLAGAVAQRFGRLMAEPDGQRRAKQLADRLLAFEQRRPTTPCVVDLHSLVSNLEDLLSCALGDQIQLRTSYAATDLKVQTDPAQIELILMRLAVSAAEDGADGAFTIQSSFIDTDGFDDGYAELAVTLPDFCSNSTANLPELDEIARQSAAEIRINKEGNTVNIYLPRVRLTAA